MAFEEEAIGGGSMFGRDVGIILTTGELGDSSGNERGKSLEQQLSWSGRVFGSSCLSRLPVMHSALRLCPRRGPSLVWA